MSQITNLKDYAISHQDKNEKDFAMSLFCKLYRVCLFYIANICFSLLFFIFNTNINDSSVVDDIMLVNTATALLTMQNI